jgi:hypothetical protein
MLQMKLVFSTVIYLFVKFVISSPKNLLIYLPIIFLGVVIAIWWPAADRL